MEPCDQSHCVQVADNPVILNRRLEHTLLQVLIVHRSIPWYLTLAISAFLSTAFRV